LQQTVRPLVVRRCDRCWDVVPRVVAGEHLTIRTLDVSSALLGSGPGEGAEVAGCCSLVTTGLKIITMWRSSMSRVAGWLVDGCLRAWTGSLAFMR
jgi:hypothetical protein